MEKGKQNLADYFTKHHPKRRHATICSTYLFEPENNLRNYFELLEEMDQGETT
jgi:hypothetical protein